MTASPDTRRRAELRLTQRQVASRASLSMRYVEFLESYPAVPPGRILRQLAAALQTTPAALLGGGTGSPPVRWDMSAPGALERLPPYECRPLISAGGIGRIGFVTAGGLVIVPVNFAYDGHSIVLRTGTGSVIAAHADGPVSFEVDRVDDALKMGWSVLIRGQAHRVAQQAVIAHLRRCADVQPWPFGEHDVFVRITPQKISGRRITSK
jgi:nitroimidazol reductase NimA-like FMN-containing flavoprotein (pyridoxamine 5'-phosphate oxidase superfamily)